MNILALNAGGASLKFEMIARTETPLDSPTTTSRCDCGGAGIKSARPYRAWHR